MTKEFKIVQYDDNWKSSTIELLMIHWGLSSNETIKKFDWRYNFRKHPIRNAIFLAIDLETNQAVGFRAFLHHQIHFSGKVKNIYCPADAFVRADWRKKGIMSNLIQTVLNELNQVEDNCVLNLSSNEKSTPINLKHGWVATDFKRSRAFSISFFNWFKKHKGEIFPLDPSNHSQLAELSALHEAHNQTSDKLVFNKTVEDYQWLIAKFPKQYFGFIYEQPSGKKSYVIYRLIDNRGGIIEEYGAKSSDDFKRLILALHRANRFRIFKLSVTSKNQLDLFKNAGMIILSDKTFKRIRRKNRNSILVRLVKNDPSNDDYSMGNKDIRKMNNWLIFNWDMH